LFEIIKQEKSMKKIIMFCAAALLLLNACEPVSKDIKPGGLIDPSTIVLSVEHATPGSNSIVLINETPGVTGQWSQNGNVIGTGDRVVANLVTTGDNKIDFTAFCDGGTVTSSINVNVTTITFMPDIWLMFAGAVGGSKTWVWDTETNGGNVYGAGGYGHSKVPNWGANAPGTTTDGGVFIDPTATITFDLINGTNVTITQADGTQKGSFSIDEKKAIANFSTGTLNLTGVTLPAGFEYYSGGTIPQTFEILPGVDENHIVLNYAAPGSIIFDPAWATTSSMWVFKAVTEGEDEEGTEE
jgi:hypothetical protein